jgi:hypothetical protein
MRMLHEKHRGGKSSKFDENKQFTYTPSFIFNYILNGNKRQINILRKRGQNDLIKLYLTKYLNGHLT